MNNQPSFTIICYERKPNEWTTWYRLLEACAQWLESRAIAIEWNVCARAIDRWTSIEGELIYELGCDQGRKYNRCLAYDTLSEQCGFSQWHLTGIEAACSHSPLRGCTDNGRNCVELVWRQLKNGNGVSVRMKRPRTYQANLKMKLPMNLEATLNMHTFNIQYVSIEKIYSLLGNTNRWQYDNW